MAWREWLPAAFADAAGAGALLIGEPRPRREHVPAIGASAYPRVLECVPRGAYRPVDQRLFMSVVWCCAGADTLDTPHGDSGLAGDLSDCECPHDRAYVRVEGFGAD